MNTKQRGAVFVLSVVSVVVVGMLGLRAIQAPDAPRWPGRIAVIGLDESTPAQPVTYLGVADPATRAIATVPIDAVVEVPGSGFLRAYHAWRLGNGSLARDMLGRLFGVAVSFAAWGPGFEFSDVARSFVEAQVPEEHADDLRRTLEEAAANWERLEVGGERKDGPGGSYLIVNPASVARTASAIGGLGTKVFVDPTTVDRTLVRDSAQTPVPTPAASPERIEPSEIAVDVLNGGDTELGATKTAQRLRELGYDVGRIADHEPKDRERSFVYVVDGKEAEALQVGADLGYPVEPLPDDVDPPQDADVLVLLGDDAKV